MFLLLRNDRPISNWYFKFCIITVWDELNNRSAELEHLLTNGNDNNVFDQSINMISDHVCNIETVLVEEKIPSDLTTAKCSLNEHMVCVYTVVEIMYVCMYVYIFAYMSHSKNCGSTYVHMYICDDVFIHACMATVHIYYIESIVCMY